MATLAPIVLFTYNRPIHTKKTLISLKENVLANQSTLYIYVDGPKQNASVEQKQNIDDVKKIIREEQWCKEVIIIESQVNKGLAQSIITGVTEIIEKYGKIIVLEDDLVSDKWFLKFMNDSLDLYEFEDDVACISGYIYPVDKTLPQTFFIKGADCWGWATWKKSWDLFDTDGSSLLKLIETRQLSYDFNFFNTYPYVEMLKDQIAKKNNSWAILWYASAYLKNKLTLYPAKSLIHNIGIDGSGIHSGESLNFDVSLEQKEIKLNTIEILENDFAKKSISEYFKKIHTVTVTESIFKKLVKLIIPNFIIKRYHQLRYPPSPESGWSGDFELWEDVLKQSTSYNANDVFEKVDNGLTEVLKGNAAFERDSIAFKDLIYSENLLHLFKDIASENNNELNIVDYGGSLGSIYYQYKTLLSNIKINWSVVEQSKFVEIGQKKYSNKELNFFYNINDALTNKSHEVLLLSSVLAYLKEPETFLHSIMSLQFKYIILYRTAFVKREKHLLTIQNVPPQIYKASYPAWFLNEYKIVDILNKQYKLHYSFEGDIETTLNVGENECYWKCLVFKLK